MRQARVPAAESRLARREPVGGRLPGPFGEHVRHSNALNQEQWTAVGEAVMISSRAWLLRPGVAVPRPQAMQGSWSCTAVQTCMRTDREPGVP